MALYVAFNREGETFRRGSRQCYSYALMSGQHKTGQGDEYRVEDEAIHFLFDRASANAEQLRWQALYPQAYVVPAHRATFGRVDDVPEGNEGAWMLRVNGQVFHGTSKSDAIAQIASPK